MQPLVSRRIYEKSQMPLIVILLVKYVCHILLPETMPLMAILRIKYVCDILGPETTNASKLQFYIKSVQKLPLNVRLVIDILKNIKTGKKSTVKLFEDNDDISLCGGLVCHYNGRVCLLYKESKFYIRVVSQNVRDNQFIQALCSF
jgi:hypothetical protein